MKAALTSPVPGTLSTERLSEAERELARVHRAELARHLRAAAEVRMRSERERAWLEPGLEPSAARLRRTAEVECTLAASEGRDSEELALLFRCVERPASRWPSARDLAEASLTAEDSEEGRLCLARVHLAEDTPRSALRVLAAARRRGVSAPNRWRLFAGLGRVHERTGGERLALDAYRVASAAEKCSAGPRVDALFLALATGMAAAAEELSAGLDAARPPRRDVDRALETLVARQARQGRIPPWRPAFAETHRLFRRWLEGGAGSTTRLCRELAGRSAEGGR